MECCYECLTSNKTAAVIILTGFMMINIGLNGALIGLYVQLIVDYHSLEKYNLKFFKDN
jgi:hypothetical protein